LPCPDDPYNSVLRTPYFILRIDSRVPPIYRRSTVEGQKKKKEKKKKKKKKKKEKEKEKRLSATSAEDDRN
jgi:rRNA processing protein Gar1